MRTLGFLAAMFLSVPALGARYVRYDCLSYYYEQGTPSSYYHGCSAWYSPGVWNASDARQEAFDASIATCRQDSGGQTCHLRQCTMERTDLYSPSWSCPLE